MIGIIGCGHMGSAIANALLQKNHVLWTSNQHKPSVRLRVAKHDRLHWTVDNTEVVKKTDVIFLAVKPSVVYSVLREIKGILKNNQILISIAAGIPLKKLYIWSGNHKKIVRVMPNLPAEIFEGISIWKGLSTLQKKEKQIVVQLLNAFGKHIEVKNEDLINISVGGSGPAYVALFLESMVRFAEKTGFTKHQARILALQSVLGSARYIEKTGVDFEALISAVQTKRGTTEASFKILKAKKWGRIFEKALHAAYRRAREIGK